MNLPRGEPPVRAPGAEGIDSPASANLWRSVLGVGLLLFTLGLAVPDYRAVIAVLTGITNSMVSTAPPI